MTTISLGNDLVDLCAVEPRLHTRYWGRVCTTRELEFAEGSTNKLWSLWAAKEASFKAIRQVDTSARFVPRQYEFEPHSRTVRYREHIASINFRTRRGCVMALAMLGRGAGELRPLEWWATVNQDADPSLVVRQSGRHVLGRHLGVNFNRLIFSPAGDTGAAPRLLIDGQATRFSISFSHHGAWATGVALLE